MGRLWMGPRRQKWTKIFWQEIRSIRPRIPSPSYPRSECCSSRKKPECRGNSWEGIWTCCSEESFDWVRALRSDVVLSLGMYTWLDRSLARSLTAPRTVSEVSAALISSGVVNLNASHQMDRPADSRTLCRRAGGGRRRHSPTAPSTRVAYLEINLW